MEADNKAKSQMIRSREEMLAKKEAELKTKEAELHREMLSVELRLEEVAGQERDIAKLEADGDLVKVTHPSVEHEVITLLMIP